MTEICLDNRTARRLLLDWQGLLPPRQLQGCDGLARWMDRIRCLQFDPLDRCGRNADLTLQSRIRDYRPFFLRQAVEQERSVVEGWDKQMSFYPAEDWPGLSRLREGFRRHQLKQYGNRERLMARVVGEIERRGPLCAGDFKSEGRVDWRWAPSTAGRAALEGLFDRGGLMIARREGNRKYYDLPDRVLGAAAAGAADPHSDHESYLLWRACRRLGATGMMQTGIGGWLGISGVTAPDRRRLLDQLVTKGEALRARIEESNEMIWLPRQAEERLRELRVGSLSAPQAALLAPLDNLLWDRQLIARLFGFDYVWEVYKPAARRLWGYYVLPVLYGDRLVARCEPVRDRQEGVLILTNWWWEQGVRPSARMGEALRRAFLSFLRFLDLHGLRPEKRDWPAPGLDALDALRP